HDAGVLALLRRDRRSRQLANLGIAELRQGRADAIDACGARRAGRAVPQRADDVMRDKRESFEIIGRAFDAADADEADAVFISSDSNITRFANSNVHQNMSEISAELTLRLFVNGAMGVASTTSFDAADIAEMANVARETARHSLPLPNFKGLYRGDEDTPGSEAFHG